MTGWYVVGVIITISIVFMVIGLLVNTSQGKWGSVAMSAIVTAFWVWVAMWLFRQDKKSKLRSAALDNMIHTKLQ